MFTFGRRLATMKSFLRAFSYTDPLLIKSDGGQAPGSHDNLPRAVRCQYLFDERYDKAKSSVLSRTEDFFTICLQAILSLLIEKQKKRKDT